MPVSVTLPGPWTHRHLTAGGTRFHAAMAGPEPAAADILTQPPPTLVILLHAFPQCWWTWRHVIPVLADAGHRVAALDLRGFGGSDRPPSGYDLVTLADDVARAVPALGHERAVVIGNGLGGQVAWTVASRRPDLVNGIAPIGAPHPVALRSLVGRRFSGSALQYLGFKVPVWPERSLSRTVGMEALLRSWAGPRTGDTVAEQAEYYAALLARPGAARSALAPVRNSVLSRAERAALATPVTVPVLTVQGEVDPVQPAQAHARDTHHVAGQLRQATVRGVGHFPQEEAPQALADLLLPFLAEVA